MVNLRKNNPYHGKDGKFTTASGAKTVSGDKVSGCRNLEDLHSVLEKDYGVQSGLKYGGQFGESLEKCDFSTVRSTVSGITSVMDDFPEMKGQVTAVMSYLSAGVSSTDGSKIILNEFYFSHPDRMEKSLKEDSQKGFHPKNTDARGIGAHEAGHVLEKTIYDLRPGAHRVNGWMDGEISKEITREAFSRLEKAGMTDDRTFGELRREVSGYAATDTANIELFAEAISDCCSNGSNAHPFSREIKKVAREKIDIYKADAQKKRKASEDKFARWLKDHPEWGSVEDQIDRGLLSREGAVRNGLIRKFNPYHGADGRFTTGASAVSFTYKPGKGKMYDRAISREKARTAEEEEKKAKKAKPVLAAESMPALFRKNRPATKSLKNFCAAVNACKDADPDCVKVLSKVSTDVFDFNQVSMQLSNAKGYSIQTRSMVGMLIGVKVTIPKIPDSDNVSEVATTAHELTHFVDLAKGGHGVKSRHASGGNQDLLDAISAGRGVNANVSDETASLFKEYKDFYFQSREKHRKVLREKEHEISEKYGLDQGKYLFNLTSAELKAYRKDMAGVRKEYNDSINKDLRTYGGGAVSSLSDMYDAMCAGTKSMKGTSLVVGHGTEYFASTRNRAEELLAEYVSIGVTNPKMLKYFEKDYPKVYKELKNQVRMLAE